MKSLEFKKLIKEEVHSALNEYDPNQDPENKGSEAYQRKSWKAQFGSMDGFDKAYPEYSNRSTDKEMLQRITASQLPDNFTILDIIERYKEHVVGHLRSEGELNENEQFPDTSLTNALKIHFQVAYEKGLEAQPEDDYDSFDEKYWKNNEFEIKDTIRKYFRFPMKESGTLTEDKGDELANKVIMRFRKALRNLNDDEVYSFREKIAMAIDAKLK